MPRTFEYDDYPRGAAQLWPVLDSWKERFPNFCATLFCIPQEMTRDDWRPIVQRDWVQAAPHGFRHKRRECFKWDWQKDLILKMIAADERYTPIYKAPWYMNSRQFISTLHRHGFTVCYNNLPSDAPHQIPPHWRGWCVVDAVVGEIAAKHVVAHPVYGDKSAFKARRSEINPQHVEFWESHWSQEDRWEFVSNLTHPICRKVNIGCGPQVWDDWLCLDNRDEDPRVRRFDMLSDMIPLGPNKADVVFTSHVFNYLPEEQYPELLLECWRVMRPGAVLRMAEDRTDSGYAWRRPGQRHATGLIQSLPTKEKIVKALKLVGFEVFDAKPGQTRSPHKDVLQGDSRGMRWRRGHKFYIEAVKSIYVPNMKRYSCYDVRATKSRHQPAIRYRLPQGASA